ncbi:ATP-binding protein [Membranihabitans marinus]|uniref:ATP-binding protein n=1 Tax=Membranihabitans marinus TaxID=1227546 RepID=UPI001F3AC9E8|nr:ATP-binding protein [Membranihabitans marinus]
MENRNPFEHSYFIGYVNQVMAQYVKVHFPSSTLLQSFTFKGERLNGGLVGNFVVIEGEQYGFLGKILELSLPEKERLELSEKSFKNKDFHPIGKIEILLSFDLFEPSKVEKGLNSLPVIGAKVFVCSSDFIKGYFRKFGVKEKASETSPVFELGTLTYDKSASIEISQQALFGRHCAVVGTTGGGKSFTVSKLLEGIISNNGKAIIIDATGEYHTHDSKPSSYTPIKLSDSSFFHYSNLTIGDLFVLLRPSGQVQAPKLMEAIKSLKVLKILEEKLETDDSITKIEEGYSISYGGDQSGIIHVRDGNIVKAEKKHKPFNRIYSKYMTEIEGTDSNFDIKSLAFQITKECVFDTDFNDNKIWGRRNDNHLNNCVSLILRVQNLINNPLFDEVFGFNKEKVDANELTNAISAFLNSDKGLLRIGFEKVGFDFQAREIVANSIGKFLLEKARKGDFKNNPLVLFVDEAHQYLNKAVKDEYFELTQLNSFDSIAKECRKHGLFLTIATQMPRDIPVGTLSQIGTFIVHRLINHFDKESVANASSSANRNTLDFLPILGAGEAILMGVDFPMPVMLKINKPKTEPDSATPLFTTE